MTRRVDWESNRARLAEVERAAGHADLTEAQLDAILAQRADVLAAPPPPELPVDTMEVVRFHLGSEHYAFPSAQVREVQVLSQLTPLPGTPPFVAGLTNVRGQIVSVIDLRPFFGVPVVEEPHTLLLLSSTGGQVGILATGQPTVDRIRESDFIAMPSGLPSGIDPSHVRGVAPDMLVVLDAERLIEDKRLLVDEDG